MKRIPSLAGAFCAFALVALIGCAALGVATPQTFNEREAAAIASVTAARDLSASLLAANKISVADARNVQKQCDVLREGISVASTLHATDPAAAETRLAGAIAALTALNGYLKGRG